MLAAFALSLWPAAAPAADPSPELSRAAKYVFATAGGCGCHTPPDAVGLNAGGQKFELLIGTVYSRNITPDAETGIGKWTDAQVASAIRRESARRLAAVSDPPVQVPREHRGRRDGGAGRLPEEREAGLERPSRRDP